MRRSKEIIVLLALLVGAMGFVLWYVIDRRARNRAVPPATTTRAHAPEPSPALTPASVPVANPVNLAEHDRKTVDFSSGQPVVKDSPEDKAAIDAAMKDIAEASKNVTFDAPPQKPAPPAPAK